MPSFTASRRPQIAPSEHLVSRGGRRAASFLAREARRSLHQGRWADRVCGVRYTRGTVSDEPEDFARTAALDLLKATYEDARDLVPNYVRGFALYVAITGGLVKFAFDTSSTPTLRHLLAWFGILTSLIGLLVCLFGEIVGRQLKRDIYALADSLKLPKTKGVTQPLHYLVITSLCFVIAVIIGWIYILFEF
jgi:hypothetical protein